MNEKLKKAYKVFNNGNNILSLSEPELIEHIQVICCADPNGTENCIKQLAKVHSLSTVYNVKVMKALSRNNTILTGVVIFLAICTLALSIIQFIYP